MRYLCAAPTVAWVTDQRCTLVAHEASATVFQLTGLGEVLWDCLVQGFSYEKIVCMAAEMRGLPLDAAELAVQAILREWQDLGLVVQKGAADG